MQGSIAAAAPKEVKLPAFSVADPLTWFQRAEVTFRIKKETSQTNKADYVLEAIKEDLFPKISPFLRKNTGPIKYDDLKTFMLQKFSPSPEERASRLMSLSRIPIGDQRATDVYEEMETLATCVNSDGTSSQIDLLRVIFFLAFQRTYARP